jgi:uncharacterized delta-60 repeat protein
MSMCGLTIAWLAANFAKGADAESVQNVENIAIVAKRSTSLRAGRTSPASSGAHVSRIARASHALRASRALRNIITIAFAWPLLFLSCASAQTFGTLDATFGSSGTVTTAVGSGSSHDVPRAVIVQLDGKIVVAGTCAAQFCLVRYETNGALDLAFGTGGRVLKSLIGGDPAFGGDQAFALALQSDGKILLAGQCISGVTAVFCVARFTTAGEFDTAFGAGSGWLTIGFSSVSESARAIAVQPDGKIVVAGQCNSLGTTAWDFCFARLLPSGDLDTSFNAIGATATPGKVIAPRSTTDTANQYATSIAIQPNGKIVLAGYCSGGSFDYVCLLRYEANGAQFDVSFGAQGWAINLELFGQNTRAYSIALQPNEKIVVGGECATQLCALRFLNIGAIDTDFADNSVLLAETGTAVTTNNVGSVALRADGAIVLAGWANPIAGICYNRVFAAHSDGSRLGTFTGLCSTGYKAVALQADGKIITVSATSSAQADFYIERRSGGEMAYRECSLDVDGDGKILATTDALIHARVALGMKDAAVINGITFAAHAARKTWPDIRTYLVNHCGMVIPPS